MTTHRKKLIEVALPLDAINTASAREKSIRHGHPSTLHLWWARRPLATARAVIFAQMVDDPSASPDLFPTEADQEKERERLFGILKELVLWKNTANEKLLERARAEIRKSWRRSCVDNAGHPRAGELFDPDKLPAFHDPFAGGGALPLEAQRLGLEAHASDLNPVAVLINKAMIEIPPKFAGRPPVNPEARAKYLRTRESDLNKPLLGARASRPHKAWHSRGYLPHLDQPEIIQSVTFRLADSIPADVVVGWKNELALTGKEAASDPRCAELRDRIERYAGQGHGACWLRDGRVADQVENALLHFDGVRYRLLAWVIMPNHVHALIETMSGFPLEGVIHSWKSFTAKKINRILGRSGQVWEQDYFDRYIRDEKHLATVLDYIEQNPVKAGLVDSAHEWRWSSATRHADETKLEGVRKRRADETEHRGVGKEHADKTSALPGLWTGAQGLAEDVRYYGKWMRDEAEKRIGHLYPKIEVTAEMAKERPDLKHYVDRKLTVIAWLWARTVKSPNPAFADVEVPLASTFMLSTKKGKEAYVEPVIEGRGYRFTVKVGLPPDAGVKRGTKSGGSGSSFLCLMSGVPMPFEYLRSEAKAGRMGARFMAVVAEGDRGRVYLTPTEEHEAIAQSAMPSDVPETDLPARALGFRVQEYGMTKWRDLFTPRQLVALTTFSNLVAEAMERVKRDYLGSRASRPRREQDALDPGVSGSRPGRGQDALDPRTSTSGVAPSSRYHRTRLPHFEAGEVPQHVCFRLADSLPQHLLQQWEQELGRLPGAEHQKRRRIEEALDQGHGACWLRRPEIAALVRDALRYFEGDLYRLHGWVVMPNHVHVLVTPLGDHSLSGIVHSWKSDTANQANKVLERSGEFWYEDYFDRFMRDEDHFATTLDYIRWNPVKAGLCTEPEDWEWTSYNTWNSPRERGHPALNGDDETPGQPDDETPLRDGGAGATAYAEVAGVYLALSLNKVGDRSSTICGWDNTRDSIRNTFGRQAIPMVWDFAESNTFSRSTGSLLNAIDQTARTMALLPYGATGLSSQADAQSQRLSAESIVSTDPPYYDNVGYADLSDFFYVWLRRTVRSIYPDLFATLAVPKAEELVATPYRHGSKEKAETFFLDGMEQAMRRLVEQAHPGFPVSIYYAFKQSETKGDSGISSTGWETFLDAVIRAGFAVTGTWPMRTELSNRMVGLGTNVLASSIVLVCRKRPADAPLATRREFVAALRDELPVALAYLQSGNIAPVDLAQAAIGPGMAIYTRYARVLDAEGKPVSVREALALINQTLDEVLAEQEGEFDADSRWALAWFEQQGFGEGEYGVAETLSKAKNTSIAGIVDGGILASRGGKVRLLRPDELASDWNPTTDARLTVWEAVHHLVHALESGGESAAATLVRQLGGVAETARELAYRLYTVCERKNRADEARAYNGLVQSWPEIAHLSRKKALAEQSEIF